MKVFMTITQAADQAGMCRRYFTEHYTGKILTFGHHSRYLIVKKEFENWLRTIKKGKKNGTN